MSGKEIFYTLAIVLIIGSVMAVGWGFVTKDFIYMTSVSFVFFLMGFLSIWIAEVFEQYNRANRMKDIVNKARRRQQFLETEEEEP